MIELVFGDISDDTNRNMPVGRAVKNTDAYGLSHGGGGCGGRSSLRRRAANGNRRIALDQRCGFKFNQRNRSDDSVHVEQLRN